MGIRISVLHEGFTTPTLFSKASRLVFSGTPSQPSPKSLLPVSVYLCRNTGNIADDWAAGSLQQENWMIQKSTDEELWCHYLSRTPLRWSFTIYAKPKSSGRPEGDLENFHRIISCAFYMGIFFTVWSLMCWLAVRRTLHRDSFIANILARGTKKAITTSCLIYN